MKKCKGKCGLEKPLSEFFKDKNMPDGYRNDCKLCKMEKTYAWREKNRDKYNAGARKWGQANPHRRRVHEVKRSYGLTEEQLLALGHTCAICGTAHSGIKKGTLHVDHDHKTGRVRGVLCNSHNAMLGYADDSIEVLEAAIAYLKRSQA